MEPIRSDDESHPGPIPSHEVPSAADQPPAWEQIETGRYMPRRIRGSCVGRELG